MNQRRHAKAFPLAATLIIVALAICFATFAVKALTVKYQVVQGGSKIKQLERELTSLTESNQSLLADKISLISWTELKKKLDSKWINLVAIPEKSLFIVGRQPRNPVAANLPAGQEDGR